MLVLSLVSWDCSQIYHILFLKMFDPKGTKQFPQCKQLPARELFRGHPKTLSHGGIISPVRDTPACRRWAQSCRTRAFAYVSLIHFEDILAYNSKELLLRPFGALARREL